MRAPARNARRRGLTLIEVVMSMTLMGLVVGAVAALQRRTQDQSRAMLQRARVERQAIRALERVVAELGDVALAMLNPDPNTEFGASTLLFRGPGGLDNLGNVVWPPADRIGLQLEPGEADNGVDDDGDGLVDERRLVLTRAVGTASETVVTITNGVAEWLEGETAAVGDDNGNGVVDEAGFSVRRTGDLLRIRLTLEQAVAGGGVERATAETALLVRN
jgi:prepilin-type N-terminal cleavage/methylation domain-containing protein